MFRHVPGCSMFRVLSTASQGHWKRFEADKAKEETKNPDAGILQNIRNVNEQLQEKMLKLWVRFFKKIQD